MIFQVTGLDAEVGFRFELGRILCRLQRLACDLRSVHRGLLPERSKSGSFRVANIYKLKD